MRPTIIECACRRIASWLFPHSLSELAAESEAQAEIDCREESMDKHSVRRTTWRITGRVATSKQAKRKSLPILPLLIWSRSKYPVLRFLIVFALIMVIFYIATAMTWYTRGAFPWYLERNAAATAKLLSWFGEGTVAEGVHVRSPRFSLQVKAGCDAVEPSVLYVAAVLAFPVRLRRKLVGLWLGVLTLMIVNVLRLATLHYTGAYFPTAFETMHVAVWQPLFIVLVVGLWSLWMLRVTSTGGEGVEA